MKLVFFLPFLTIKLHTATGAADLQPADHDGLPLPPGSVPQAVQPQHGQPQVGSQHPAPKLPTRRATAAAKQLVF